MPMTGHERLIAELRHLLAEAEAFEFHDFKNTKYAAPKNTLAAVLYEIRSQVIKGTFDNEPEDERMRGAHDA